MIAPFLRTATEADRAGLIKAYRAAWVSQRAHAGVDGLTDLSHVDFNAMLPADLDSLKPDEMLRVAALPVDGHEEIAGYCFGKMLREEDYPGYFEDASKVVEIKRIFTDPNYQRLGLLNTYCRAIVEFGISRGATEVYVCTPSKNTFEHEWFYRYGFDIHSQEASICPYQVGPDTLVDHDVNMIHFDAAKLLETLQTRISPRFNKLVDDPAYVGREKSYGVLEYVFRKNNGLKLNP